MKNKKEIEKLEAEKEKLLERIAAINRQLEWLKPPPKSVSWSHKRKPGDPRPMFKGAV
jgi:hypothetical protein